MTPDDRLETQRKRDQAVLDAARAYRAAYRTWRELDRVRDAKPDQLQDRIDAQQACAASERALLEAARA